jgi:hypothetical protein
MMRCKLFNRTRLALLSFFSHIGPLSLIMHTLLSFFTYFVTKICRVLLFYLRSWNGVVTYPMYDKWPTMFLSRQ